MTEKQKSAADRTDGLLRRIEELESRLRKARRLESIGTLAGGIAHDFNNILFLIVGYSEMCLEQVEKDKTAGRYLEKILQAADRAKELTQQILLFSREGESEKRPLRVQPIIKESLKLLRSAVPSTVEIRQEIDKACGPVLCDPIQVRQLLLDLCTRVFEPMVETGGGVEVRLEELSPGKNGPSGSDDTAGGKRWVLLAVSGFGYSRPGGEDGKPAVQRGDSAERDDLALQSIIEAHGGFFEIETGADAGPAYHAYFPLMPPAREPDRMATDLKALGGNERILVVDDDQEVADMLVRMLQTLGYRVFVDYSAAEALERFTRSPGAFDLVATDLTMPGMTGTELVQNLTGIRPDLPVVLCSGISERAVSEKVRTKGIREIVLKPASQRQLAEAIRRALDEPRDTPE